MPPCIGRTNGTKGRVQLNEKCGKPFPRRVALISAVGVRCLGGGGTETKAGAPLLALFEKWPPHGRSWAAATSAISLIHRHAGVLSANAVFVNSWVAETCG